MTTLIRTAMACIAILVATAGVVEGGLIVDTGTPVIDNGWVFSNGQYFAGEFTVAEAHTINSIEGFFNNQSAPGNVVIALHAADNGHMPGQILQSATLPVDVDLTYDWRGLFGLGWDIAPGTYWASFMPEVGIQGIMPGTVPNPLDEYGQAYGLYNWADNGPGGFDYLDIALRIDASPAAVPEPIAIALWGCIGAVGLIAARRRKA